MMSENQKRNACRIMSEQERNRQNAKAYPSFIPLSSPQYKPLPPLTELEQCQITICAIMASRYLFDSRKPYEMKGIKWHIGRDIIEDVMSGKNEPFHGAAEYLQNVSGGKA